MAGTGSSVRPEDITMLTKAPGRGVKFGFNMAIGVCTDEESRHCCSRSAEVQKPKGIQPAV